MVKRKMIGCLVAGAGFCIVASGIAGSEASEIRGQSESVVSRGAADTRADLSMEEIVAIINGQGLGEVYEVEREWGGYEVKIRDPQGKKLKLYVDSKTGEVLHQKGDDDDDDDESDDD